MRIKETRPHKQTNDRALFVWRNPGRVIDRNGRPVITTGKVWAMQDPSDNLDLNWDTLNTAVDIKDAIKCYVAHTIESQAPKTAHQVFKQLKYCFTRLPPFNSILDVTYEVVERAIANARIELKDGTFTTYASGTSGATIRELRDSPEQ